jgi:phage tail protein X
VARHTVRKHTIHDGDTLERLATRYLGDARHAETILAANRTVLKDPQVLPIGVEIVIPRLSAEEPRSEADDSATRNLVPLPAIGFQRSR